MAYRNSIGPAFFWCVVFIFLNTTASGQSKQVAFLTNSSLKLAPPIIQVDSLLFKNSAWANILLRQDGAVLHYTLDGSKVSIDSPKYESPIELYETTQLRAKAFHTNYQPSETISLTARKIQKDLRTTEIRTQPNPSEAYSASGAKTLIDGQKGSFNFRQGNLWLGFQESEISVSLNFEQPMEIQKVVVSVLNDQDSWIFLPQKFMVLASGKTLGSITLDGCHEKQLKHADFVEIVIPPDSYSELTVKIAPMVGIPEWHAGKGTTPWTFIDEILIE
ncbi:MAG: chitobiase/beta-hexosaminidase C-terminal domain-containing protein [Bacteroidota bacterium]